MSDGEFDEDESVLDLTEGDIEVYLGHDLEARIAALEIALSANCHNGSIPVAGNVIADAKLFHAFLTGEE